MISIWYLYDIYMIFIWYLYDIYMISIWYLYDIHMISIWYLYDTVSIWYLYDIYMIFIWYLYDIYMISIWYLYDIYMISIWYLYDIYMISIWYLYDIYLIAIWYLYDIHMISIWYLYDIYMISIWYLSIYIYIYISDLNVSISADPYHVGRVSKDFQGTEAKPCSDCQAQSQRWTWLEEVPVGGCLGTRHEFDLFPACTLPVWELYSLTVVLFTCNIFQKKAFSWTTRNTHQLTLPSLRSSACCRTYASAATACSYLQLRLPPSHPMPRRCGMAAWIWIWFTIRSPKLLRNEENKDVYPTRIIKNKLNYTSF